MRLTPERERVATGFIKLLHVWLISYKVFFSFFYIIIELLISPNSTNRSENYNGWDFWNIYWNQSSNLPSIFNN